MAYLNSWTRATLREREAVAIARQSVEAPGGSWQAQLEALIPPDVSKVRGVTTIVADLGWDEPLRCFVYDLPVDIGSSVDHFVGEAQRSIGFRGLRPIALTQSTINPLVHFRAESLITERSDVPQSDLKLTVMPRPDFPLVCAHASPGYARSFVRVVTDFARSFEFESERALPMRGELWFFYRGHDPVGYSRRTQYALKDGSLKAIELSSEFGSTEQGQLLVEDRSNITTWTAARTLTSARYTHLQDAQQELKVSLDVESAVVSYRAEEPGRILSGQFTLDQPLRGSLFLEETLLPMLEDDAPASFAQSEYHPEHRLSGGVPVHYELSSADSGIQIRMTRDGHAVTLRADDRGLTHRMTIVKSEGEVIGRMVFRLPGRKPN